MENITEKTEIIKYPEIINDQVVIDDNLTIVNCSIDDNKNIWGYRSDNNVKAKYSLKHNKWFYGSNIGSSNLIPLNEREETEKTRIIHKSWEKAKENREKAKTMNDIAKAMLDRKVTEEQAKRLLGVDVLPDCIDIDNLTISALIVAKGIESALLDGSFKWAELVRDTAGYKPKNEVDISADITTEADRSLMEKVSKRLNIG